MKNTIIIKIKDGLYLKNKIIIKLPSQNVGEAIKIYTQLKNLNKIGDKTTIDLRIPNMIILKNGWEEFYKYNWFWCIKN